MRCEGEFHQSHMDYVENNDIHHAKVTGVSDLGLVCSDLVSRAM